MKNAAAERALTRLATERLPAPVPPPSRPGRPGLPPRRMYRYWKPLPPSTGATRELAEMCVTIVCPVMYDLT
jgi:hypothetical protein